MPPDNDFPSTSMSGLTPSWSQAKRLLYGGRNQRLSTFYSPTLNLIIGVRSAGLHMLGAFCKFCILIIELHILCIPSNLRLPRVRLRVRDKVRARIGLALGIGLAPCS